MVCTTLCFEMYLLSHYKAPFCVSGASEGTISMQEGEVLAVVEEDKGDGWTRVRRHNGDEGYIPTSYVNITLNK